MMVFIAATFHALMIRDPSLTKLSYNDISCHSQAVVVAMIHPRYNVRKADIYPI